MRNALALTVLWLADQTEYLGLRLLTYPNLDIVKARTYGIRSGARYLLVSPSKRRELWAEAFAPLPSPTPKGGAK